jgi:CubicO group peptidase (beta-lactamase class C family)
MMKRNATAWCSLGVLILLTAGTAAGQNLPTSPPEEVGLSAERLSRLDRVMREYVDEGKVAGLVTLVIRSGRVAHFESFGHLDREKRTPMPKDAVFRIASQSKAVTTVAVMILQEEGRLVLTEPVSKYLPEFRNSTVAVAENGGFRVEPAKREITIRDLLTHTAGISYGAGSPAVEAYRWAGLHGWYFAEHDEPIGNAIRRLAVLPLSFHPGERWVYGFGTDILGHLVERVSGMSLAEFFQARIFEPLKMVDTHFYLPEGKLDRLTPVYGVDGGGRLELVERPEESAYFKGPRKCYSGGAGLLSTARDYGRFLLTLLNGGELEGVRILSRKSVEAMTTNQVGDLYGARGFGLGFWINEDLGGTGQLGSIGAYGWGGAYHTTYWVDPEEQLVALLMCQLLPARGLDLHPRFNALVYQAIVD